MTIAISGSTGFIGSALVRYFTGRGHTMLPINARPEFIKFDIQQIAASRPDVIIHCAAYGNHYHHFFSYQSLEVNTVMTFKLLEVAAASSARFVYFSTSSLLPHMPVTLYSATKRAGEELCKAFHNQGGAHTLIVRPSSVTGPGEQAHHLIPTLIRSCLQGAPMKFAPDPTHDFIDINDVCTAVDAILCTGQPGHTYNVSSGVTRNNLNVKKLVEELTFKQATITSEVTGMRIYDNDSWIVDNTETRALGWAVHHTLPDSIRRIIKTLEPLNVNH